MYIYKSQLLSSFPLHCRRLRKLTLSLEIPSTSAKKMKVVAAFLLAVLSGKASPNSADIKNILGSVGAEGEDAQIELLLKEVSGKDCAELIAAGREKLASVPSGGGVAMTSAPSAGGGGAAPAAEAKKEEKKEDKEESDDDMGFSLFE